MDTQNRRIEEIYNQYKDHIYNYIYRMCNDRHLALDIVQQTFVKVLSKPEVLEVEHLKAYLFTIARNKLHDEWKQKSPVSLEGDDSMLNDIDNSAPDDVHQEAEQKATKTAVVNAIKQLPHNLRELMLLRYIEDLSVVEIADITARTVTDIKVSLHRARLKFEQKLTALMYSKVALSRNRCNILTDLLLPFGISNIPEQQLAAINKHIIKCEVCIKDSEEMKRSKQLFTALPLLPFPIAFDELAQHLPQSTASTPVSEKQDTNSAVDSDFSVASNSMNTKLVAGTLAVVIAAGSAIYFNSDSPGTSVSQQAQNQTSQPVTKTVENKNVGTIKLKGKFANSGGRSALGANIEWNIYPDNSQTKNKQNQVTGSQKGREASFNLLPGKYTAVAQLGELKQSSNFEINAQKTQTKSVIFNAGLLDIELTKKLNQDIDVSKVSWIIDSISTEKQSDSRRVGYQGNKPHYLLPGEYIVSASYPENLRKSFKLKVSAGQKTSLAKVSFDYTKLKLNAKLADNSAVLANAELKWQLAKKRDKRFQVIKLKDQSAQSYLLAPGKYRASVRVADSLSRSQQFEIKQGQANKQLTMILDAGKILLESTIKSNDSILSTGLVWSVFENVNKQSKPIYSSRAAKSQAYVAAGSYRISAKAGINVSIDRKLDIVAGQIIKMQPFVFNPGAIKLAAKSEKKQSLITKNIKWSLEQETGDKGYKHLTVPNQAQPLLVLTPGRYRVTANYADRFKQVHEFSIKAGEVSERTMQINDDSRPSAWR